MIFYTEERSKPLGSIRFANSKSLHHLSYGTNEQHGIKR